MVTWPVLSWDDLCCKFTHFTIWNWCVIIPWLAKKQTNIILDIIVYLFLSAGDCWWFGSDRRKWSLVLLLVADNIAPRNHLLAQYGPTLPNIDHHHHHHHRHHRHHHHNRHHRLWRAGGGLLPWSSFGCCAVGTNQCSFLVFILFFPFFVFYFSYFRIS